jgi:hypothetical protein
MITIEWFIDSTYQVLDEDREVLFQGTLPECESFYRLAKEGVLR